MSASTSTNTPPPEQGSLKDTFESILIALILAFVFRGFVVEAFVIPTGSMAPTLLGAHMRFTCEDCGYAFTVNYSGQQLPGSDDINIPSTAVYPERKTDKITGRLLYDTAGNPILESRPCSFNLTCPNCGHKVPQVLPKDPSNDATGPAVYYGDRILVLKYPYLFHGPDRWDVVVFKSPYDQRANDPPRYERPRNKPDFQQNYIKRLVGLPNEQLMVLDGDIYTRPNGTAPWAVQPKSPSAQDAVWRIVADNDYQPRGLPATGRDDVYTSPWAPLPGTAAFTAADNNRSFTFAGPGTAGVRFDHLANPRKFALTDWLAFGITAPQQQNGPGKDTFDSTETQGQTNPLNHVSDLQLNVTYARAAGEGPLRLSLVKRGHRFTAEFTPGKARLLHALPDGTTREVGSAPIPAGSTPIDVTLQNVDYRVALRVNGKDLVVSTPAQYAPDVPALIAEDADGNPAPFPEIELQAADQTCVLNHLSLYRDIFYTNHSLYQGSSQAIQFARPAKPLVLGPGEFFVLGDNSNLSLDARYWDKPVDLKENEDLYAEGGRVPERFMLGKAFFVYWPAGHRPITESAPGLVPNFGQMRPIK